MDPARRASTQFHASLMEPWDGPACVTFTDGTVIGAVLDRNGLRPGRWWHTSDGLVVLGSEAGVLDIDPAQDRREGPAAARAGCSSSTPPAGEIVHDHDGQGRARRRAALRRVAARRAAPAGRRCPTASTSSTPTNRSPGASRSSATPRRSCGSCSRRWRRAVPSRSARWAPTPRWRRCRRTSAAAVRLLHRAVRAGHQPAAGRDPRGAGDLARRHHRAGAATCSRRRRRPAGSIVLPRPVHRQRRAGQDLAHQRRRRHARFRLARSSTAAIRVHGGGEALAGAIERVRRECSEAVERRRPDSDPVRPRLRRRPRADPVAAADRRRCTSTWSATGQRTQVGLVVETGECREVHHVALLIGYGAAAVNPYLAFEIDRGPGRHAARSRGLSARRRSANYVKALSKGVLKVMSKMGISTIASYCGAQVFEAFGLAHDVVDEYFTGTPLPARRGRARRARRARSRPGTRGRTRSSRPRAPTAGSTSAASTSGAARASCTCSTRRRCSCCSTRPGSGATRCSPSTPSKVEALNRAGGTLRGLFEFRDRRPAAGADRRGRAGSSRSCKRFATGAMSYGSISAEAHETLAIAMNRIGGKSNCGEGGEDARRFTPDAERRPAPIGGQAGRLGPVRRHQPLPGQRRRHPDQGRAGRQAGRGRPAARLQGLPVDRAHPALDARASG